MGKFIDLTNRKFDRLTVIKRVEDHIQPNGNHNVMYECECECGNKIITRGRNLTHKVTRSCGCLAREIIAEKGRLSKKYNKYNLSGDYGIGYTSNTNEEFYFDLEDYNKIKDHCWCKSNTGHIISGSKILLNRLIMNIPKHKVVYHINRKLIDNRKKNLKILTKSQSQKDNNISKNNTSGYKGVSWNKQNKKWEAYITKNRKRIGLGLYKNKNDAIEARKKAEEKYFGQL